MTSRGVASPRASRWSGMNSHGGTRGVPPVAGGPLREAGAEDARSRANPSNAQGRIRSHDDYRDGRSEERRVGKEQRNQGAAGHGKEKERAERDDAQQDGMPCSVA